MRVRFDTRAAHQLINTQNWITDNADLGVAFRVVDDIIERCGSLGAFPSRGTPRDDLFPGLRTIPHRRRYTICYLVSSENVVIVGIVGAGQDIDALFDTD